MYFSIAVQSIHTLNLAYSFNNSNTVDRKIYLTGIQDFIRVYMLIIYLSNFTQRYKEKLSKMFMASRGDYTYKKSLNGNNICNCNINEI